MEIREYDMMTDEARGIRTADVLQENDSYHALEKIGGLIVTEPRICWLLETAAPWRHAVSTLISTMPINPDVG